MLYQRTALGAAACLLTTCVAVGCGDDDDPAGAGGTGGSSQAGGGGAGANGTGGDGSIPAVKLEADPATACPPMYQGAAPVAGLNTGYDVAGQSRAIHYILPDASFTGPRPLFMAFNGTGETGPSFSDRANLEDFAARGFIVVAPSDFGNGEIWPIWDAMHAPGQSDMPNPDLELVDSLIQCTAGHFEVDANRLYMGGHSAGGIMANYLIQRRSDVFAGAIIASGVFSLTSPQPPVPLSDTFTLVTWGGDNDEYSGGDNGVSVPQINFVEQAAIASTFYSNEPNVGQAHCFGANVGHAWLSPVNDYMIDLLLAHPKGVSGAEGVEVNPSPGAGVTCSGDAFAFEGGLSVLCPSETTVPGCELACQLFADCAVENATVGPILAPQLADLGFSGTDLTECGGCITKCEADATTMADAEVMACISAAADAATCGPGIDGALPAINAINDCCEDRSDSPYCVETCGILLENGATVSFLPSCVALGQ